MTAKSEQRLDQLDGLRTIAVAAVIVQHAFGFLRLSPQSEGFESGAAGVRLFFVLSGFLITGILLKARETAERAGASRWVVWRAFYYRRALRILPLGYLAIGIAWFLGSPTVGAHPWMYLTYTSNFYVANHGFTDPSMDHFWSLAIEEQFYLFWPIVILATPTRLIGWGMSGCILLSMAARAIILAGTGAIPAYVPAFVLTPSRLDALAVGGLLAWFLTGRRDRTAVTLAGLAAAGVAARVVAHYWPSSVVMSPLHETGNVLLSAVLVVWAATGVPGLAGRFLATRPMVWIGTISYGVYVYHMLIAGLAPIVTARLHLPVTYPEEYGWMRCLWMVATTLPVAALSWTLFERPLNDLKVRFPYVPATARTRDAPALTSADPVASRKTMLPS